MNQETLPQAARLLRSWVRIPPGAWIFVCCECRVLSGRGLCDELITLPNVLVLRLGDLYVHSVVKQSNLALDKTAEKSGLDFRQK